MFFYVLDMVHTFLKLQYVPQFHNLCSLPNRIEGIEGVIMLDVRFKPEHQGRLVFRHAEHVIAVVTSDVCDDCAPQIGKFWDDTVPFALAAPLCINLDAKDRKRPFAPRHQTSKYLPYLQLFVEREICSCADADDIGGKVTRCGPEMIY